MEDFRLQQQLGLCGITERVQKYIGSEFKNAQGESGELIQGGKSNQA